MLNKIEDEKGNIIYTYLSAQTLTGRIICERGNNNVIFITKGAQLQECKIYLCGDNSAVFIGASKMGRASLFIYNNSSIYIGNGTFFNEYGEAQIIRVAGGANVVIGNSCAFSTPLEISTTDVHLLYDKHSRVRINTEKSIFVGDHVWIGRDVKIFKGANIGSGSMVGSRSLVTAGVYPYNSVFGGIPCRCIKQNAIVWAHPSSYFFKERDILRYSALSNDEKLFTHGFFGTASKKSRE